MSFNITNFGKYDANLTRYADIDGYVPEAGDAWTDFTWDAMTEWDDQSWSAFRRDAVRAAQADACRDADLESEIDDDD